ncbi:hypothetical protein SAMN04489708_1143 [Paracidovorax cattleyae]|uniref:Uncharacterized protein n=1 Tax=Paracidovorax cattleyae TaxID=80868 RepID=A0A1H0T4W0_9BURK|nr:hypothetical protein SAMN04489708_1143 [Paracidovorax cattleyae]
MFLIAARWNLNEVGFEGETKKYFAAEENVVILILD